MKKSHDEYPLKIMQIRAFCMIAERGMVSEAANNLFRTQSANTRSIRDLEHTLSTPLFERHASGMLLTEMGKCVLPQAIAQLVIRHPGVKVVTNESAFGALVTELRAGDIDFILGALRQDKGVLDIHNQVLFEEKLILLARPDHPLADRKITPFDLAQTQ